MKEQVLILSPSEWVKCNLCGEDKTTIVSKERGFNIVKCKFCGLVYVNPRLKEEERLLIYKETTKAEANWFKRLELVTGKKVNPPGKIPGSDFKKELNKYYRITLKRIVNILNKKTARLLDIGCGPGFWIYYAKLCGWDAFGFDIVEPRENLVEESIRKNIYIGKNIECIDFPKRSFDVITLWHVLEHTPDPAKYLQYIKELLKDDGLLIIAVPNYYWIRFKALILNTFFLKDLYLRSKHFNKWGYFFPEEHLYNFTLRTLKIYFKKYGFKIEKIFIDKPIQKKTYLSEFIYIILFLFSKLINLLTFEKINIYINLILYVRKNENT